MTSVDYEVLTSICCYVSDVEEMGVLKYKPSSKISGM